MREFSRETNNITRGGGANPFIVTYSLELTSESASICYRIVIKGPGSHTPPEGSLATIAGGRMTE
jgi:hypothetical protein